MDKNAPPSLSISDTNAREGEGATFTVTLAGTTSLAVTVRFNTADGTAKVERRLRRAYRQPHLRAGREVEDDHRDGVRRHPFRGRRELLRRPRRPRQRRDHEGPPATHDRGQRPDDTDGGTADDAATARCDSREHQLPRMQLGPPTIPVGKNGIAKMHVTCQKASPIVCAGTVELQRATKPLLKLGKKTFSVKKGIKGYGVDQADRAGVDDPPARTEPFGRRWSSSSRRAPSRGRPARDHHAQEHDAEAEGEAEACPATSVIVDP